MDIRLIFKYYLPHLKKYKKSTALVLTSYALAVAGSGMVTPVLYKRIMDIVSGTGDASALINTVLFIGGMLLLRLYDDVLAKPHAEECCR
ncbi:MAG: hypothetical protein UV65_C0039G0014 [Parcubacteria group bacterium GW2011_GWF2_43_11]|nr:MAG: hypothetical protein UV65_C0039G0014 [Parcubacteria group bacterium GW2011_GWF2_43_11]